MIVWNSFELMAYALFFFILGLEGGPLSSKYQLAQFHFHWGTASTHGSEHTVDGQRFAEEVCN